MPDSWATSIWSKDPKNKVEMSLGMLLDIARVLNVSPAAFLLSDLGLYENLQIELEQYIKKISEKYVREAIEKETLKIKQ